MLVLPSVFNLLFIGRKSHRKFDHFPLKTRFLGEARRRVRIGVVGVSCIVSARRQRLVRREDPAGLSADRSSDHRTVRRVVSGALQRRTRRRRGYKCKHRFSFACPQSFPFKTHGPPFCS